MRLGEGMKWSSCSACHQRETASQSSIMCVAACLLCVRQQCGTSIHSAAAPFLRDFYKAQFISKWILINDCRKWWSAKIKHLHVSFPDVCMCNSVAFSLNIRPLSRWIFIFFSVEVIFVVSSHTSSFATNSVARCSGMKMVAKGNIFHSILQDSLFWHDSESR